MQGCQSQEISYQAHRNPGHPLIFNRTPISLYTFFNDSMDTEAVIFSYLSLKRRILNLYLSRYSQVSGKLYLQPTIPTFG